MLDILERVKAVPGLTATFHLISGRSRPRNIWHVRARSLGSADWNQGARGNLNIPTERAGTITALVAVDNDVVAGSTREERKALGFGILYTCQPWFTNGRCVWAGGSVDLAFDIRVLS